MVVVQHEKLHTVLWGPAARDGRTKRSDIIVYVQLVLVAALAVWQFHEYEKPVAVRLAACGAAFLFYFRSAALFVRLVLLLSFLVAYGDIFVPAKRAFELGESFSLRHVPLLVYSQVLFNNSKLVYLVLRATPKAIRTRRPAKGTASRKPKAA